MLNEAMGKARPRLRKGLFLGQISRTVGVLGFAFLGFALGCGKATPELETWPVHGTIVDQKGKPVQRGAIQFQSTSDQYLNMSGATDEDGKYSMRSFRKGFIYDGAVVGDYKVIVIYGETGAQFELPEPFSVEPKDNEFSPIIKR